MTRRRPAGAIVTNVVSGGTVAYTISGTVYDADGSTPVASATIALGALSATSAANGTYTISDVPPGTSGSMTCTKTGYLWTAISVAAMSGNLTAQNYTNTWYAAGGSVGSVAAVYRALGAASLDASYNRVAGSGGNADLDPAVVGGNAPGFNTALGWQLNGTDDYLKTGLIPDNNYTVIVGFSKFVATGSSAEAVFGSINAGQHFDFYGTGTYVIYANRTAAAGQTNGGGSPAEGVVAITPGKLYINGELRADNAQSDRTYREVYIGATNTNGSPDNYGASNVKFIAFYTPAITEAQIQAVSALFPPNPSDAYFMPYGDSKSVTSNDGNWPNQIGNTTDGGYQEYPYRIAIATRTVATAQAAVDAELALKRGTPAYVLWNLGVNDAGALPAEATWKSNAQYIIDAMVTKWPSVKIYFMRVWNRAQPANCATINGWYGDLVTANPGVCFAGPDESVWLEGGDNGVTMTTDGTHYSVAGHAEATTQWLATLP